MEIDITLVVSALGLGFASGFHCIGMCGPIALSLGLTKEKALAFYLQNITYQLGRVFTYALFGALLGLLGEGLDLVGFQKYLTIFSGVLLIIMAFFSFGNSGFSSKIPFLQSILLKLKLNLGRFMQKSGYSSRFLTGVLNGFLPCGAVYMALTASLAYGGVQEGALFMGLFGVGTIPFMFVVVLLGNFFTQALRTKVLKVIPVFMAVLGIIFILRGLELGIPYISPQAEALQVQTAEEEPKCMCH